MYARSCDVSSMTRSVNPYRPGSSNNEDPLPKERCLLNALFDAALAALLYVISALNVFAIRTREWNSDMVVISLIPLFFAVPTYVILRSISFLKSYGLFTYLGISLFFLLLAASIENVYPVFLGMRRDVVAPMALGVIFSSSCLLGLHFIRDRWKYKKGTGDS